MSDFDIARPTGLEPATGSTEPAPVRSGAQFRPGFWAIVIVAAWSFALGVVIGFGAGYLDGFGDGVDQPRREPPAVDPAYDAATDRA